MRLSDSPPRVPVLFLIFNRPSESKRVFEAIRKARPPVLYVAADGPRPGRPDDEEKCLAVRSIISGVDWPCDMKTLFRDRNLGCKAAVADAISWFFDNESSGIILEDDVVPGEHFIPFCEELLCRYADDPRVAMIGGFNPWSRLRGRDFLSYSFSSYALIWGWGTWRRAWSHYDPELTRYRRDGDLRFLSHLSTVSPRARSMWRTIFDDVVAGRIDTWDYQWFYSMMRHGAVAALPSVNLVENIGFGPDATHARGIPRTWSIARFETPPPGRIVHPPEIRVDVELERAIAREVFHLTSWNEVKHWIKSKLSGISGGPTVPRSSG